MDSDINTNAVIPQPDFQGEPQEEKQATKWQKLWYKVRSFFANPANVILVIFLLVLSFFIFYPLFMLFYDTFVVSSIQEMFFGVKYGSFTGLWWHRMIASDVATTYFWVPLGNSILMSLLASLIAIQIGRASCRERVLDRV